MVIEIAGHLSLNDLLAANRLSVSFKDRVVMPWVIHPFLNGVALFFVAVVLGMWWFAEDSGDPFRFILFCAPLILLAVFPFRPLADRRQLARAARQGVGCFAYTQSRIDKQAICVATNAVTSTMKWEAFRGFRESQDVVVLYYCDLPSQWMVVSRAKFKSEGDWQAFRQLVATKLRPV